MSKCTQWVDRGVIACKQYVDEAVQACVSWADEGSNSCTNWADEGSNECSAWAEKNCHWYSPWNCVAGWFCQAYYWVAKWVCKAWMWVAKWVCKVFGWITKAVCVLWSWAAKIVCVAWNTVTCAALAVGQYIGQLILRLLGRLKPQPNVEHLFVLMLENRSFDHMLGFSAIHATDAQTGSTRPIDGLLGMNFTNTSSGGVTYSPTTPAEFQLPNENDDPPHEFANALAQLCGASASFVPNLPYPSIDMSGFIDSYSGATSPPETLFACFSHGPGADQLPVFSTLAKEFVVCDRWFCSLPGPTWPNRFFALAASSAGLDDSPSSFELATSSTLDGFRFSNGHIFDLLDDHCIDWTIFEGDKFPIAFALSNMNLNALQGRFKDMDDFGEQINNVGFKSKFVFIEPRYGEGDYSAVTDQFDHYRCGNSMHPINDVTRGEQLIKQVYETLRASPIWEKSVLIITFDEHGGFVDHVPPPSAVPPGDTPSTANIKIGFKFDQLGPRVPTLIVSPLIPRNLVDGTVYDHTSILASLERLLGMKPLTNRDKNANDFLHLFSLQTPRKDTPEKLPGPATSGIKCEDDDHKKSESKDGLLAARSRLLRSDSHAVQKMASRKATSMQKGFASVALRRLRGTQTAEQQAVWLQRFWEINTERDFGMFMTEAKLALKYKIDLASENRFRADIDLKMGKE